MSVLATMHPTEAGSTTVSSPDPGSVCPTGNLQLETGNSSPSLQNTTNHYTALSQISDLQRKAILHILAGKPDSAVACAIGVHRVTVTNWRLRNTDFQDELFRARDQLWTAELDKVRAALSLALDEIHSLLKYPCLETRFRAAKALLPLVGHPRLAPIAPKPPQSAPHVPHLTPKPGD